MVQLLDHVETPAVQELPATGVIFILTAVPPCLEAETQAARDLLRMTGYPATLPVDAAMPALTRMRRHVHHAPHAGELGWSRWPERLVFWTAGGTWVLRAHVQAQGPDRWRLRVAGPVEPPPRRRTPATDAHAPAAGAVMQPTPLSQDEYREHEPISLEPKGVVRDRSDRAEPCTPEVTDASSPEDALAALAAEIRARQGAPRQMVGSGEPPEPPATELVQASDAQVERSRRPTNRKAQAETSLLSDVNDYEAPAAILRGTHRLAANAPWRQTFGHGRDVAALLGARGLSLIAAAVDRDDKFIVRRLALTGPDGTRIVANVGARAVDYGQDNENMRAVMSAARPVLLVVTVTPEAPDEARAQKTDGQKPGCCDEGQGG